MAPLKNSLKIKGNKHTYRIKSVLGQGGFGITYLAEYTERNSKERKLVAIKEFFPSERCRRGKNGTVIPDSISQRDFLLLKDKFFEEGIRLLREFPFRGPGQAAEPDIVQVIDIFSNNGTAYLVMKYVHGKTLKDKVKKEGNPGLPEKLALQYGLKIVTALKKVHVKGLLHRDIKPENIMTTSTDDIVLIDFGSAREFTGAGDHTVSFTDGYTPIEQYSGQGMEASDVFSVGATLFYCLTRIRPVSPNLQQHHTFQIRNDLNQVNPVLSRKTKAIILKCMELDAPSRYSSADKLKEELQSAMDLLGQEEPPEKSIPRKQEIRPKQKIRSYLLPILVGLVVLAVLSLAVLVIANITRQKNDPKESFDFVKVEQEIVDGIIVPAFEIQAHEVTNQEYCNFLNALDRKDITYQQVDENWIDLHESHISVRKNEYYVKKGKKGEEGNKDYPVTHVTYLGAIEFAKFYGYDLPTIDEWKAAVDLNIFKEDKVALQSTIEELAWIGSNSKGGVNEIKTSKANSNEVYDLIGNVEEWVTATNVQDDSNAILIGGSFQSSLEQLSNLNGKFIKKDDATKRPTAGFRCVIK